jgi:hypothetical protein
MYNNNNNNSNGSRAVELGDVCSRELHFMSSVRCLLRIPLEVSLCGHTCIVVTVMHFVCGSRDVTQCEPRSAYGRTVTPAVWHCTDRRDIPAK